MKFPPNGRHLRLKCIFCRRWYRRTKSDRLVVEDYYYCSATCERRDSAEFWAQNVILGHVPLESERYAKAPAV